MPIILFIFLTTLVCAFGKTRVADKHVPTLDGRIVGGSLVDITQHPHQVSLMYNSSHICGGTIVTPKWILTAAHCVEKRYIDLITVRAGSSILNYGGITVSAKVFYHHGYYDRNTYDYDIAAVELWSMLNYSTSIQPVKLPRLNQRIKTGTMLTITGWGITTEGGFPSNQLLAVEVPVALNPICALYYQSEGYNITKRMLCAGDRKGGKGACQGDSGGPLVANNNVLWGISSWGYGCARPKFYGVYAHISNLRSWITQVTGA